MINKCITIPRVQQVDFCLWSTSSCNYIYKKKVFFLVDILSALRWPVFIEIDNEKNAHFDIYSLVFRNNFDLRVITVVFWWNVPPKDMLISREEKKNKYDRVYLYTFSMLVLNIQFASAVFFRWTCFLSNLEKTLWTEKVSVSDQLFDKSDVMMIGFDVEGL